jgi:type IV pilus modification protein PilV
MQHIPNRTKLKGGFIIEVLVAMVIFSVGIIGLLNMQSFANKAAADASYRSEAAMLVNDYINKMRAADRSNSTAFISDLVPGGAAYQDWSWRGSDPDSSYSFSNPAPGTVHFVLPNSADFPPEVEIIEHAPQSNQCIANPSDCTTRGYHVKIHVYWLAPSDKKSNNGNNPSKDAYNTFKTTAHIGGS